MRALALLSALATGLVLWTGLGRDGSSRVAAAVVRHRMLLASAAATSVARQAALSSAETASSSEASASAAGGETGEAEPASASGASEAEAAPEPTAPQTPVKPSTPPSSSKQGTPPTAGAAPASSKIKHVFVITLASPGYEQTWGPASGARYLTSTLRPQGALLSNYFAVGHLDLPNYIAMISGQPPNTQTAADCPTFASYPADSQVDAAGRLASPGCLYPASVLTLPDQLTSTRRQWRAYVEDLANGPKPVQSCRHPSTDQPDETQHARPGDAYAARHNPFVYFHSLLDLGDCASDDLPLTQLPADLASEAKTPNYVFVAPNLCHDGSEAPCLDGSPGGLQAADAFLAEWVPKILASAAYRHDGLLVITFSDAPASDNSGCCESPAASTPATPVTGGGRVGALLLSRFITARGESTAPYNHYSLLRTVEDVFGLAHLANAGQAGVKSFSSDVLKAAFAKRR
jgi:hypothetical protein